MLKLLLLVDHLFTESGRVHPLLRLSEVLGLLLLIVLHENASSFKLWLDANLLNLLLVLHVIHFSIISLIFRR